MITSLLITESAKRELIRRLSDESRALLLFYSEVPEDGVAYERVGDDTVLIQPPYDFGALSKWWYLGNWAAIHPAAQDFFQPLNRGASNAELAQRMRELGVTLLILSEHDDVEWHVLEDHSSPLAVEERGRTTSSLEGTDPTAEMKKVMRGMELMQWEYSPEDWQWHLEALSRREWLQSVPAARGARGGRGRASGPSRSLLARRRTKDYALPSVLITSTGIRFGVEVWLWRSDSYQLCGAVVTTGELAPLEPSYLELEFDGESESLSIPLPVDMKKDVEELCQKLSEMIAGRKGERGVKP